VDWFADLYNKAQDQYGVNPLIFIGLFLFSYIPFYIGVFQILRGLKRHDVLLVVRGTVVNRLAWGLPYYYVLFFGHDLPWAITALVIIWPLLTLVWAYKNHSDPKYVEKWQRRVDGWYDRIPKKWRKVEVVRPDKIITDQEEK